MRVSAAEQELHQNLNKKINGQARYELECIKLWGSNWQSKPVKIYTLPPLLLPPWLTHSLVTSYLVVAFLNWPEEMKQG